MRERGVSDVNDGILQPTLREMRVAFGSSRLWLGLAVATVLLGLSGPFETLQAFALVPRLLFWAVVVVCTYAIGGFVSVYMKTLLAPRGLGLFTRIAIISVLTGFAVTLFIFAMNILVVGVAFMQWEYVTSALINTFLIATLISAALHYFESTSDAANSTPSTTRLLSRLDLDKRGAIISLSVQDHYVEVATSKGLSLVLIRLGDAISEANGIDGMQVHRSHWIATKQVVSAKRVGDRGVLQMHDGREIPVSRSYMKAAKDAGLFV